MAPAELRARGRQGIVVAVPAPSRRIPVFMLNSRVRLLHKCGWRDAHR